MKYLPLLLLLLACSQSPPQEGKSEGAVEEQIPKHIGLIAHDPAIDTLGFEVCNERTILPYFHHKDLSFKGEKPALVSAYQTRFTPSAEQESGYITIRFIVNCNGETGRFRIIEMDEKYQITSFSSNLVNQLFEITQSLEGWDVYKKNGKSTDYVRYVTFKMVNGEIKEIMP